ncbi:hypothetical protein BJ165DRAFT_1531403 [Panaeolus papilionaceus]|nr:hypothetical protein BJ165DRAFT_1531403 [Panaeolus papilionaceus]
MQYRSRQDASDSDDDVPVDETLRFPEIAVSRPGAFNTRELPLPRNTRQLLSSNRSNTNLSDHGYAVHIPPLNLPIAPSPLRVFHALGEQPRRASFDGGSNLAQSLATTSAPPQILDGPSTPALSPPNQPRLTQFRDAPAFASPMPRRYSDQLIPSFRLRAAKWVNVPSPSPSPDTAPSTPGLSDEPPATPSPNIPPTIPSHVRSKSDGTDTADSSAASLVHRRVRSSDRVSPYPSAIATPAESTSTSDPAAPEVKKKRKRTVKQRIRWIEVSPGMAPPNSSVSTPTSDVAMDANAGLPNRKPPPRRAPAAASSSTPASFTSTSKPWKEAQIKLDLRLIEPPATPVILQPPVQFGASSSAFSPPIGYPQQAYIAEPPMRRMSVPPISTLEDEAGPSRRTGERLQKGKGKGKGRQLPESSDVEMDTEMGVDARGAGRTWCYPSRDRRGEGMGDDVDMLANNQPATISPPERPSEVRWVYAQASTNSNSLEHNWGHGTNAMRSTRVHQAGDVTWAYTRFDVQVRARGPKQAEPVSESARLSKEGSPARRGAGRRESTSLGAIARLSDEVVVKQEVDVEGMTSLHVAPASLLKQEPSEDPRPINLPASYSPSYLATAKETGYPLQQQSSNYPLHPHFSVPQAFLAPMHIHSNRPPSPNPAPASTLVMTASHDSPMHLNLTQSAQNTTEGRSSEQAPRSIVNQKGECENADNQQSLEGAKDIVQHDSEPSPRESPMVETPGEPLAMQDMVHCMTDIERENEVLAQKLSRLAERRSPKSPCPVTKQDTTAGIASSDPADHDLEEGEIMEH